MIPITPTSRTVILRAATAFVDGYLGALRALPPAEVSSPSFGYGRGGVAYTLLRAGTLGADRALVLSAKRWAAAGIRGRRSHRRGSPIASFGLGMTGLHAIHALAAHAADDDATCRRELRRFVDAARRGRGSIDLYGGMAGRLAGAAIVMRSVPDPGVRALGDDLAGKILEALEARAVRLAPQGAAHGWPGVVHAALVWQAVARSLPEAALRRAVVASHRHDVPEVIDRRLANWAHGHAGMALMFARAYVQLGDPRFLAWAREAAAQTHALPSEGLMLPNGAAGLAYCMFAVAAADPEGPWRDAAWIFAGQAFARAGIPEDDPWGVWSGLGGVCCLALDLIHETDAGFPGLEA